MTSTLILPPLPEDSHPSPIFMAFPRVGKSTFVGVALQELRKHQMQPDDSHTSPIFMAFAFPRAGKSTFVGAALQELRKHQVQLGSTREGMRAPAPIEPTAPTSSPVPQYLRGLMRRI